MRPVLLLYQSPNNQRALKGIHGIDLNRWLYRDSLRLKRILNFLRRWIAISRIGWMIKNTVGL